MFIRFIFIKWLNDDELFDLHKRGSVICHIILSYGDSASHPTVSTVEWGSLFGRFIPDRE